MRSREVITQDHFLQKRGLNQNQVAELKLGFLHKNIIEAIWNGQESKKKTLLKLMTKFDLLVPYCTADSTEKAYLVPCLLKRSQESERLARSSYIPSLHFQFFSRSGDTVLETTLKSFVPHGLFHRLVSQCCNTVGWKPKSSAIFYNYLAFVVDRRCVVSLYMINNHITLSVHGVQTEDEANQCSGNFTEIRKCVEAKLKAILACLFPNLMMKVYIECTCEIQYVWNAINQ